MIDALADGAPIEPLARYFEFWLLRLQGVYPQLSSCPGVRRPVRRRRGDAAARGSIPLPPLCAAAGGTIVSIAHARAALAVPHVAVPSRRRARELETAHSG